MVTELKSVPQEVPGGLLACAAEPAPPADDADLEAGADFELALVRAGRDCRAKLGEVRGLVAAPGS